ncbi:MAG: response regulator transcription factor [Thermoanaerobaculia bacterium]|nr:response regulator transcription factor [Thermoanaerobaculia bacterium]
MAKETPSELGKGTIALVDDEENIRETVGYALRKEGYRVDTYSDGAEAWQTLEEKLPDVAVLDIMMPRMDGLDLCRKLRAKSETLPIIFLTSRDEEFDRVLGLELGADDYLCKPFSMRELVARVKVLFRRLHLADSPRTAAEEKLIDVGGLRLDLQRYTAHWQGAPVQLTVTEFLILNALARHPGHVKSREQLVQEGYPHDSYVSDRTIDSHIKRLRRKLTRTDPSFDEIETVYGLGYRYRQPGASD